MRKYFFTIYVLLFFCVVAKAQLGKEAWHWQFGDSCSLDFSSGVPIVGISSIKTNEGCASISDPNTGQLLFYTDGIEVWDRNNNQMPNGYGMIGGQGTSTQAALIIPKPGSSTVYYLISADQGGYYSPPNQGVHYSVVDMTLNGSLGDITTKNTLLTSPPTTEKLTAVKHCNGIDYWIIDHPFNSNTFNAYLLTSAGINPTPISSSVGTTQNNVSGTYQETIGYLKPSPNGKKLACAVNYMNFVEVFDFDNTTGIISNPIYIPNVVESYGVSFSPDNYKLYITSGLGLFQFDISSNNATTIISSAINIPDSVNVGYIGAMQLAPDGKIYVANQNSNSLAVIKNPNSLGLSCNYKLSGLVLNTGTKCEYGLPNFIDANNPYLSQSYSNSLCVFPNYTLAASSGSNYKWSDGDTTQNININSFGNYWVSYFNTQGCKEIDTFHIIQAQPPVVNIIHDTAQCRNLAIPISENATDTNVIAYLWNDGFTLPIHTITNVGSYWINYTFSNFCISRDSFTYVINNIPFINLGNDTTFCLGDLKLNAFNTLSSYLWNTGQKTSSITATKAETYWVKVINQYGCINYDTLVVYPETSLFNFNMPNIITSNNDGINDFIDFGIYQFSSLKLDIFNRWGNKIFTSTDPTCIWKPIEDDGSYYYVIQYIIDCGSETQNKILRGFITVIR